MQVLVVGAGIAGPTLAYWLLRGGHDVTLVERSPELRRGGYLVDFWGAGFDVAERMGIVEELRRRGYRFTEARAIDQHGRRVASFTPESVMGTAERYISIARSELAQVIYRTVDPSVELLLGDTVRAIADDGSKVQVSLESGSEREYDLVVGADGLHSQVRRLAFGPDGSYERYLGIVVAAFELSGYRPRDELVAMMHAEVGYQVVRLSLHQDVTLVLISLRHQGRLPADDRDEQQALLRSGLAGAGWETPALLELMPQAPTFYFDSVSQIRMPAWTRGRVALVGDAGACPSFLAGQGSALAMAEAYTLAAELAGTGDHRQAFAGYQRRLEKLVRAKQDGAIGLGPAFAPANRFQLALRNGAMRLLGLPLVGPLMMGRSFRDPVVPPPFPPQ